MSKVKNENVKVENVKVKDEKEKVVTMEKEKVEKPKAAEPNFPVDIKSTELIKGEKTHTKMVNAVRAESLDYIAEAIQDSLGWVVEAGKLYGEGSNVLILTVYETATAEKFNLKLMLSGVSERAGTGFLYEKIEVE